MFTKTNDGCMRIKRRTFNAYHACLADFNNHFLTYIFAFTCFSPRTLDFTLHLLFNSSTHTTLLALSSLTERLPTRSP
jgi:hypothetical protein